MHLYFERNDNAKCDCNVLSLSWMGKLPDELQEDESWKLYRRKYYQEGWLATGNARGLIGVTFTTSIYRTKPPELPPRSNYNLRGHSSEVILVKWNEPYQKLASCDSTGVIFVWIKYEGRWSIELINDRNTPVTHFSWSHDGRMALICYKDGFVLVGSVAGQRYWSSMLNHKALITCGTWTPDDQQVYFGTTAGHLIVMDVHGAMVSEVQLGAGVTSMAWSAEKFKLEEDEDDDNEDEEYEEEDRDEDEDQDGGVGVNAVNGSSSRNYVLAVCLSDGNVVLLRSFDDVSPVTINTGLKPPIHAEWSNSRKLLAIAGVAETEQSYQTGLEYTNLLKFYSDTGMLIYTIAIPYTQSPVTAMTWGHNDRRLFVATGAHVNVACVSRNVASLQLLSRLALKAALSNKESRVQQLPLPSRLKALFSGLFDSTIRCCIPEPRELRRFVSRPPAMGGRLHCTMLRNPGEPPHSYTLYVEYLGGLVPLLKGRRTSKIRPEFVIFDPESRHSNAQNGYEGYINGTTSPSCSDDSDNDRDTVELCTGSPRFRRKNRRKCRTTYERTGNCNNDDDDASYVDTLPENAKLVEVTSNIWGTKFKFHGLADSVPANLGRVTYRPSLLHLQPRQMTLVITELRDDLPAGPDPSFNPNLFSEDEEEVTQPEQPLQAQLPTGPTSHCPVTPSQPPTPQPLIATSTPTTTVNENGSNVQRPYAQALPPGVNNLVLEGSSALTGKRSFSASCLQTLPRAVPLAYIYANGLNASARQESTSPEQEDQRNESPAPKNQVQIQPVYRAPTLFLTIGPILISVNSILVRSCSVSYLDLVDAHMVPPDVALNMLPNKRLFLISKKHKRRRRSSRDNPGKDSGSIVVHRTTRPRLSDCGKSRSLDSSELFPSTEQIIALPPKLLEQAEENSVTAVVATASKPVNCSELLQNETNARKESYEVPKLRRTKASTENLVKPAPENCVRAAAVVEKAPGPFEPSCCLSPKKGSSVSTSAASSLDGLASRIDRLAVKLGDFEDCHSLPPPSPRPSSRLPRSSPSSPAPSKKGKRPASASPIRRRLLSSPLLNRKARKNLNESSDEEGLMGQDDISNYRDLETFQKAQLRQKLKQRGGIYGYESETTRREIIMHNKAPMWNEANQVYQLDFGGRVTQESAKNFQIEFRGNQVMQFGRIQGNAYTLDFQYPFSAIQAFAVALASVTQRLK